MWGDIAIAFLLAFITAFMVTPNTIKLAKKVGAMDVPKDERRMHKKPMPKLRRLGDNCRIFSFNDIFTYNYDNRKQNRFICK